MSTLKNIHCEITPLSKQDCFLIFNEVKSKFNCPVHYHSDYELKFIRNGKGIKRIIGSNIENIDDIELVLIGPHLLHGWETCEKQHKNIYELTIQFQEDLFTEELLCRNIMNNIRKLLYKSIYGVSFSKETAIAIADEIQAAIKLEGMDYFLKMISILQILASSKNQRILSSLINLKAEYKGVEDIQKVYDYIHKNFARKITLDEMASLINMSHVSFNRFMKKHTGKTLIDYLNEVRIGQASQMLIEKDYTVSEIAYLCGYNSIANFNRVFKKIKQYTPTNYREEFSLLTYHV
ncbi:helix-turn-helix transcriptional regulator [Galbibacter sp. BG1]|uniref:helix-turn-helix domain-containing protein n=1 Tax=Galbibacter sp. BG1 TaxID=1170699 RepID=UPI0015BE4FEE|nr:AraC family transcriptional regulator [Galbibacter sp. BG1]QLE01816.1 helix-turn-helix transcriptional regulator [Galbibacter sp. BG1]